MYYRAKGKGDENLKLQKRRVAITLLLVVLAANLFLTFGIIHSAQAQSGVLFSDDFGKTVLDCFKQRF